MKISEYQGWLKTFDRARDWDRVSPSQTLLHVLEEMGEVARLVLTTEGYRDAGQRVDLHERLEGELADATALLFKLAYQLDVDMETALRRHQEKTEGRFPIEPSRAEMARYLAQQEENLRKMRGER